MYKTIPNFLDQGYAEHLHDRVMDSEDYDLPYWTNPLGEAPRMMKTTLRDRNDFGDHYTSQTKLGGFGYKFRRNRPGHSPSCQCFICGFKREVVLEGPMRGAVSEYMGVPPEDLELMECFVNVYQSGDYLGIHTDTDLGCAFTYNLSKDWDPMWGGLLHIENDDEKTWTCVPPVFNQLTLMDVSDDGGHRHFVSEISKYTDEPRITFQGWFRPKT